MVHADRSKLLALACIWDECGALKIFGASELQGRDPSEEVGVLAFCPINASGFMRLTYPTFIILLW